METKKTALENIDAAIDKAAEALIDASIDKAAEGLAKCTSAASMIEFAQALDILYRLRVEEQSRIRKKAL